MTGGLITYALTCGGGGSGGTSQFDRIVQSPIINGGSFYLQPRDAQGRAGSLEVLPNWSYRVHRIYEHTKTQWVAESLISGYSTQTGQKLGLAVNGANPRVQDFRFSYPYEYEEYDVYPFYVVIYHQNDPVLAVRCNTFGHGNQTGGGQRSIRGHNEGVDAYGFQVYSFFTEDEYEFLGFTRDTTNISNNFNVPNTTSQTIGFSMLLTGKIFTRHTHKYYDYDDHEVTEVTQVETTVNESISFTSNNSTNVQVANPNLDLVNEMRDLYTDVVEAYHQYCYPNTYIYYV